MDDDAEPVAEWGERWLRDWIDEADLIDDENHSERRTREWLAAGWRSWSLETVMSRAGWFEPTAAALVEACMRREVESEVDLYRGTLHALPVWRLFRSYRSEGRPVPEFVLAKFDQWAERLARLHGAAERGELAGTDEGAAILRALQFVGDHKSHLSLSWLAALERRRRRATEIARVRRRLSWRDVARRFHMTEQAAKELLYEFAPGPRRGNRRQRAAADVDLTEAFRRMVKK